MSENESLVIEGVLNYFDVYGGRAGIDINDDNIMWAIREHFPTTVYKKTEHQYYEEYGKVRITIEKLSDETLEDFRRERDGQGDGK